MSPKLLALASIVKYEPPTLESDILMKNPPVEQNEKVPTIPLNNDTIIYDKIIYSTISHSDMLLYPPS